MIVSRKTSVSSKHVWPFEFLENSRDWFAEFLFFALERKYFCQLPLRETLWCSSSGVEWSEYHSDVLRTHTYLMILKITSIRFECASSLKNSLSANLGDSVNFFEVLLFDNPLKVCDHQYAPRRWAARHPPSEIKKKIIKYIQSVSGDTDKSPQATKFTWVPQSMG